MRSGAFHVYDAATGAPVVVILRPGKTPAGKEVRKLLSRLIGRFHRHWPETHITIRGDGHYGREEAMTWCDTRRAFERDEHRRRRQRVTNWTNFIF
jgi:Transposase DDE domain group 1